MRGYCHKCGVKLIVPIWKTCQKCDGSIQRQKNRVIKREEEEKVFFIKDLKLGMRRTKFGPGGTVLVDPDTNKIIGWRSY